MKNKKAEEARLRKVLKSIDDRLALLQQEEQVLKDAIECREREKEKSSGSILEMVQKTTATQSKSSKPKVTLSESVKNGQESEEDNLDLDVPSTLMMLSKGGMNPQEDPIDDDEDDSWFNAVMNL